MALSTAQGFIGAGDVYLTPILTGGTLGKMADIGNTTKLEIKPNSEIKEQISRKRDTYGTTLETAALQKPAELSVTIETVNRDNLRYCFMGEDAAYTQAAGAVVDEVVAMSKGGWVQLNKEDIAASGFVLKNSAGSTTYVEGTDYIVNRRLGLVMATIGGAITEAQSCKASYNALAFTGARIRGNVKASLRAILMMDGKNIVDDSIGILRCWEVELTPGGGFDFLKDDWNTIEMSGRLKTPPGKTEPFVFDQR